MEMTPFALEINNIHKTYESKIVLDQVSIAIPKASVFGLLGPNGSGKTTLLGIILNVIKPDSGSYHWAENSAKGYDPRKIGALLETPNFYPYLTAKQNLKIIAQIKRYNGADIDDVLHRLRLSDHKETPFGNYSLGMKQRLAIAACLLNNPEIIILDEPTNGLDPEGIADVRNLIGELHSKNKTIIVSSHLLDEIEKVCTHVAILNKSKLIAAGAVSDVLKTPNVIEVGSNNLTKLFFHLKQLWPQAQIVTVGDIIKISSEEISLNTEEIFWLCANEGIAINHLQTVKTTIEKPFFDLIKTN
jgi:ABC-2 type transport system ATP-binding protein